VASHFIPTCWICNKAITLENCKVDEYGRGVHTQCYAVMLAHPKGKSAAELEHEKRSWELCAFAAKEQDPQKLLALVQEINALLEERERLKPAGKPSANPLSD